MINLNHETYTISIDTDGREFSVICISYIGELDGVSLLPKSWEIFLNKNIILCVATEKSSPNQIIKYFGSIDILGGYAFDENFEREEFRVNVKYKNTWENEKSTFDTSLSHYNLLSSRGQNNRVVARSKIVVENLIAEEKELFYKDGRPYSGKYHKISDGRMMTGAEIDLTSKELFRRFKGKLYIPNKHIRNTDVDYRRASSNPITKLMKSVNREAGSHLEHLSHDYPPIMSRNRR